MVTVIGPPPTFLTVNANGALPEADETICGAVKVTVCISGLTVTPVCVELNAKPKLLTTLMFSVAVAESVKDAPTP